MLISSLYGRKRITVSLPFPHAALLFGANRGGKRKYRLHKLSKMTYYVYLNLEDLKGRTALTLAASRSQTDVIELLLSHNADVNHAAKNGTALIHATIQHSHKTMEVLLQGGANIECTCAARDGKTPLILGNGPFINYDLGGVDKLDVRMHQIFSIPPYANRAKISITPYVNTYTRKIWVPPHNK